MPLYNSGGSEPFRSEGGALLAALLLFAAIVVCVGACGGDDLIFPGNIPATPTSQNTVTPTPVP